MQEERKLCLYSSTEKRQVPYRVPCCILYMRDAMRGTPRKPLVEVLTLLLNTSTTNNSNGDDEELRSKKVHPNNDVRKSALRFAFESSANNCDYNNELLYSVLCKS